MASCLPNNVSKILVMLSMWLLISCSEAKEYVVGGTQSSWKFPLPSPDSLNHWANTHQFKIGDTLIFKYDAGKESVHEVNGRDYEACNTVGKNHVVFKDGNTKVLLKKSGLTRHFISGNTTHCLMGLKLAVPIVVDKPNKLPFSPPSPSSSPSPSPSSSSSSPSSSPSPSPSPLPLLLMSPLSAPSPSPTNEGVAHNLGLGVIIMWLGVMMLLV